MWIISEILNMFANIFLLRKKERKGKKTTLKDSIISPTLKILIYIILVIILLRLTIFIIKVI